MATLVLQVAGAFVGEMIGGPVGAMVGRAAGAVAGSMIDARLLGGKTHREGPRLKAVHGLTATEGASIPRVYGRSRVGGQIIWTTRLLEVSRETSGDGRGGKGGAPAATQTEYAYYANFAVGLCEGPIAFVRRVWADGKEIDLTKIVMRAHLGDETQEPDPLIVAKEGADNAPAYRGLAYVVFERLPLESYGNRIPQLTFEVVRPVNGLAEMIRGVDIIPGASEFAYSVAALQKGGASGGWRPETRHNLYASSDWVASIDALQALCPNLESVALVASWFGDDLRAGACTIAPRVESKSKTVNGAAWSVAGLSRATARLVSQIDGRPAFGGAPSDDTVSAAIRDLKARGLHVTFYPFVMMDIAAGNALSDPWTGQGTQPAFPWRGRITCNPAPGLSGSPDATAAAAAQVAHFFGSTTPQQNEWSYRRFILHYARLCRDAGGVDAFLLGSEFAALTRVRASTDVYPAVNALVTLANDVRFILGATTKISYAADWTEYGAHVPSSSEVRFPLDEFWASPNVDFVGIDAYWPLSDWRDGTAHLDAQISDSIYDRDYLRARVASGEAFDWYYADEAARAAQDRLPITDGAYGKPWVYRPKDLHGWWSNPHIPRYAGVEAANSTAWMPRSKSIWLVEIGCAAVDRGANAPNVFPDPKSSQSAVPHFSRGGRDDLMQARALEAMLSHFDPQATDHVEGANPVSPLYGGRMVDPARIHIWCWDARPFPAFPAQGGVWADALNYETGHWLNGRVEAAHLDALTTTLAAPAEIIAGQSDAEGVLEGYILDRPMSPRAAVEQLTELFGFDAVVSGGALRFARRGSRRAKILTDDDLIPDKNERLFTLTRGQDSELPRELSVAFTDAERDYRQTSIASRRLEGASRRTTQAAVAVTMRSAEMRRRVEAWLEDVWIARETAHFRLRPGLRELEIGDHVRLPVRDALRTFQITRVDAGSELIVEARALNPAIYETSAAPAQLVDMPTPAAVGPAQVLMLDLAMARQTPPPLQYMAVYADPWPGRMAVWRKIGAGSFDLVGIVTKPAMIGETRSVLPPGPVGRFDHANNLVVELSSGALASVSDAELFSGKTSLAVRGDDGAWEILGFARAELVAARTWRLSRLLRGLGGEKYLAQRSAASGAPVVILNGALFPVTDRLSDLGAPAVYRIGPSDRDHADSSYVEVTTTATAKALTPLAPVQLKARRTAAGVEISFMRCGRIDADAWEAVDIPQGEASESYRLSLRRPSGGSRSWKLAEPSVLYANADEIADFGARRQTLDLEVAQISAAVGEGFIASQTVAVS